MGNICIVTDNREGSVLIQISYSAVWMVQWFLCREFLHWSAAGVNIY